MEYNWHLNYLKDKLFENSEEARKLIKEKVGGDFKKESRLTSYEGLSKGLDALELSEIEENGDDIKEIFRHLTSKENIEFLDKYIINQKRRTKGFGSIIRNKKGEQVDSQFEKEVNSMMTVIHRVFKLHKIISANSAEVGEDVEKRVERIIKNCETTIAEETRLIRDEGVAALENAVDVEDAIEAEENVNQVEQVYADLGLAELLKDFIKEIKDALKEKTKPEAATEKDQKEAKKKQSISKKKVVINRLLEAMRLAVLPELMGDEVKNGGDYYKLYQSLMAKNSVFMNEVVSNKVFKPEQSGERNAFKAKTSESGAEEDQLTYLNASREWIKTYILSELDGQIESQRDIEKLLTETDRIADEKEKEIRNYYTAKDFNLGQFKGLQIKPEIDLPLCLSRSRSEAGCKIKLPVSYEDRVAESPLKKFYLAGSAIVGGLFGNIPDTGDAAFAKKAADRNRAIISGISSIISGTLGIFSKQASRDYEKGLGNIRKKIKDTFSKPDAVKEDMLGMPIQPMTEPGQLLQTPDSVPSGMDTFALLGPGGTGKNKKTKKKKPMKAHLSNNKVMSFDSFLKRSKNLK